MHQGKILAIDDEQNIRRLIRDEFFLEGFDVITAASGEEGLQLAAAQAFDAVLLDIKLPNLNGIETLKRLKRQSPSTEVFMITGYSDIKSAVESIKLGARDYVTKPFKLDELIGLVRDAIKKRRPRRQINPGGTAETYTDKESLLWCPSTPMQKIYNDISRVAPSEHTILIQGETGVGKDVLAKQIHSRSHRKEGPFVILDCGTLTRNLAESELYGHRKGAFSGASDTKHGLVENSHQGTLFLDEIGNIDLDLQKKFLRFMETKRIRRVGETQEMTVDTRFILATNLDLEDAVSQNQLRSDLFYRMAMFTFTIPPLAERSEDILPLANHFLKNAVPGKSDLIIAPEAGQILEAYLWPGNVRELMAVIQKAAILATTDTIIPDDLPPYLALKRARRIRPTKSLVDMERDHIISVLAETGGNQSQASGILGINRKTLYKKIKKYKIFS